MYKNKTGFFAGNVYFYECCVIIYLKVTGTANAVATIRALFNNHPTVQAG